MRKAMEFAGLALGGALVILLDAALLGLAILFVLWMQEIVR